MINSDQVQSRCALPQVPSSDLAGGLLGTYTPWIAGIVPRTALTVLWLATHKHEVDTMVAQDLVEAAGLSGRHWALILSSSARVSKVTYETVIGVRYPELDADTPTHVTFGNYLADRQATVGGFLPIFWHSPHNVIHATVDLGQMVEWISHELHLEAGENGCLAVLHNRNDMASALNSSDWVVTSEGKVISRGVTSCAGMTAQHVLLAQTKIGFLTGSRIQLPRTYTPADNQSQREEAFARATLALTRAQRFCFIMCPLDMKGIIGAAAVVGRLQHGAGVCDEQSTGSPLLVALKARSLDRSRNDNDFLGAFRHSAATKTGEFPPAALVEIYHEPGQLATVHDTRAVGTTPIPLWRDEAWRYRYMFGYGLDDSDQPVFLIWPERTEHNGFWLLDVEAGYYHELCQCPSIHLGVRGTSVPPQPLLCALARTLSASIVFGVHGRSNTVAAASAWHSLRNASQEKSEDCCT